MFPFSAINTIATSSSESPEPVSATHTVVDLSTLLTLPQATPVMTIDPRLLTATLSLSSAMNGALKGTLSLAVSSTPALVFHRLTSSNATQATPTMTYDPGMLTASLSLSSARKGAITSRTSILVLSPPALLLHPLPSSTARQATPTMTYDPNLFTALLFSTLNGATRTTISTTILSPVAPVTTNPVSGTTIIAPLVLSVSVQGANDQGSSVMTSGNHLH